MHAWQLLMQLLVATSLPSVAFAFPLLLPGYGDAPLLSFCVQLLSFFVFWPQPLVLISQLLEQPKLAPVPQLLPRPALLPQPSLTRSYLRWVIPHPLPHRQHQESMRHEDLCQCQQLLP